MSSSSTNPRRTPVDGLHLQTAVVLRKGATFHSPTRSSSPAALSSTFTPPSLPRAQSNLDDVLDAHRRRVALELDHIDKALASIHLSSSSSSSSPKNSKSKTPLSSSNVFLNDSHHLAQTRAVKTTRSLDQRPVLQPRSVQHRSANHHHASDSGLGSSVTSSTDRKAAKSAKRPQAVQVAAITRSAAAKCTADVQQGLSPRATSRIYEHTVKPLLAKQGYKVFHPLLLECTTKINKKDIVCLRDVEKTIFLLAPERTKTAELYLRFCLDSVRCLQTTVEYLSDREQTRPSDPPYTSGYFIDLVDQIRHYAQQLADAKEKQTAGVADTMELSSSDPIKLHGGITVNGRPMELVRISPDGRAVSIATGLPVELEEESKDGIRIKRSASQELQDEEEIMRSMARRKKNAPPEEYAPKMCSVEGCRKMFKRPCDLTKHEKTHSRPWKCPIPSCKYHEYGWPTEKEKDRHLNDKHSDNPPMYECLFKPCTYKSKRDSNRKQHMEKTHGWKYVRTKTNGSGKAGKAGTGGASGDENEVGRPSMDADSTANTTPPLLNMSTPASAQSPVVATPPIDEFAAPLYPHGLPAYEFPTCTLSDVLATDMDLPAEIDEMDFSPLDNNSPSTISSLDNNSAYQDLGQDATIFDDIYSAPVQLPPTPTPNLYMSSFTSTIGCVGSSKSLLDQFMALSGPDLCAPMVTPEQQEQMRQLQSLHHQQLQMREQLQKDLPPPFFSPMGEGSAMLYTPDSQIGVDCDEGFVDFASEQAKKGDFILFPSSLGLYARPVASPAVATAENSHLFDEMTAPSLAAGYSQPSSQVFLDW